MPPDLHGQRAQRIASKASAPWKRRGLARNEKLQGNESGQGLLISAEEGLKNAVHLHSDLQEGGNSHTPKASLCFGLAVRKANVWSRNFTPSLLERTRCDRKRVGMDKSPYQVIGPLIWQKYRGLCSSSSARLIFSSMCRIPLRWTPLISWGRRRKNHQAFFLKPAQQANPFWLDF